MSTSRPRRAPAKAAQTEQRDGGGYQLPPTVTRAILLDDDGGQRRFRVLVNDLLTIATRIEVLQEHFGRCMGLTGPQYSMLIALAHMQGERGIGVGALAQAMHVSSAFIASETGKLARLGLLNKRTNPDDGRGVLLSLAPAGRLKIDEITAELRKINDMFFGGLDTKSFAALCAAANSLVEGSNAALDYVATVERGANLSYDSAG